MNEQMSIQSKSKSDTVILNDPDKVTPNILYDQMLPTNLYWSIALKIR